MKKRTIAVIISAALLSATTALTANAEDFSTLAPEDAYAFLGVGDIAKYKEVFLESGAVYHHIGFLRPAALAVDKMGQQFLAGAPFPADQDGAGDSGKAARLLHHFQENRAGADAAGRIRGRNNFGSHERVPF